MEQELFSTAQIAAQLVHKSKNPRRDVLNIAKRLGFTPVTEQSRKGKFTGGKPEKLWNKEQRDAILADNHDTNEPIADAEPAADPPLADDSEPPVVAEPVHVVEVVVTLADRANRIRKLQADVQRGIIQIGEELIAAKEQVGHGNWSAWLETEFSWTQRTANNFMRVAERFGKMENVFQFQPSALQAMLALPEGTEQEFIDAQAAAGTPVETQSAREVQKSVKQFKQRHNTEHADDAQPVRADVPAEEPTPDLSNVGETFSIFGQFSIVTPEQISAFRELITGTNDLHALKTIRDYLLKLAQEIGKVVLLTEAKIGELTQKKISL